MQKRGRINDVFRHTDSSEDYESQNSSPRQMIMSRSKSQPDFLVNSLSGSQNGDEEESNSANECVRHQNLHLFNRSALDMLQVPRTLPVVHSQEHSDRSSSTESNGNNYRNVAQSRNKPRQFIAVSETDSEDDDHHVIESDRLSSIERFLVAWGLGEYLNL